MSCTTPVKSRPIELLILAIEGRVGVSPSLPGHGPVSTMRALVTRKWVWAGRTPLKRSG